MLYVSLVLSLILVFAACAAARWKVVGVLLFALFGLTFSIGTLFVGLLLPPVLLTFGLLTGLLCYWWTADRKGWFLPWAFAAFLLVFAGATGYAYFVTEREYEQLRAEFPCRDVESELPPVRLANRPERISEAMELRLSELEDELSNVRPPLFRERQLRQLHEEQTMLFINSPGFGIARLFLPSRSSLTLRDSFPLDQPEPTTPSTFPFEQLAWELQSANAAFYPDHRHNVTEFTYGSRSGYFESRKQVAGFQPHQFRAVPHSVRRVDLIGLLLHKEPVAYISDHLPRMDELRKAPTRPLDPFETTGLERLRKGEDIVVGRAEGRTRMLGAIRAAKQCVECHGSERGDLLGAFSYSLASSKQ